MAEAAITKSILRWLSKREGCWALKTHGGPFQRAGVPDIIGFDQRAGAFAFEVKTPTGRTSAIQEVELARMRAAGVRASVVRSLDEAKENLDFIP